MAGDKHRRKGKLQEARIISRLSTKPQTVEQLASALGKCPSGIALYLKRMRAEHRVFVCGHEPRHGSPAKVWAVGDRPDVEYVPIDRPTPKISAAQRREQVIALLTEKPRTIRQLAPAMHVVYETAGRYVGQLHKGPNRQVYIQAWRHPRDLNPENSRGGDWAPVYAVGDKPDAQKPARESSKERHARMHKDREYRRARNAQRRARYQQDKLVKQHIKAGPQTWLSALLNVPVVAEAV
jgi:hypothetical protein